MIALKKLYIYYCLFPQRDGQLKRRYWREHNKAFVLCFLHRNVIIPKLKNPPVELKQLLQKQYGQGKHFMEHIMIYNMMFGFTSIGGKVYTFSNTGKGFIHREFMDKIIIVTIVYCHNVMTNQNLLSYTYKTLLIRSKIY